MLTERIGWVSEGKDSVCHLSEECLVNVYSRTAFNNSLLDEVQWNLVRELLEAVNSPPDLTIHVTAATEEEEEEEEGTASNVLIGLKGLNFRLRRFIGDYTDNQVLVVQGSCEGADVDLLV